ncbi:MAG: tetratricopeptide repeat protein [Bacteroidetes bacterium]|nr:tetratricopeptide repeat protein [Bacteroidota bacterium]
MLKISFKNYFLFLFIVLISVSCKPKHQEVNKSNTTLDQIAVLTEKIKKDDKNAELYNSRAKLYLVSNKLNDALGDINKAILNDDKKADYYITLSDIYLAMNLVNKTQSSLEKAISLSSQSVEAYVRLAELNLYLKKYDETHKNADKAISIQLNTPKAFFIKAFAYKEAGDSTKAVALFLKTIEVEPEYYDAYMQLGLMFSNRKNKLAIDYFNSALNIKPQSIEALYGLGMFYQENGNQDAAVKSYKSILAIDPKYKHAYYNIGYINLVYKEDYNEAIKNFTDAITVDQNYAEAYYNRGYAYELLKQFDKARNDYKTALSKKVNYQKAVEGMNRLDKR